MAETITHAFVSAKSDSVDTTLVSASEWNDGHVFSGGVNGQVLIYDNTQPNNMRWTNRSFGSFGTASIVSSTTTPLANQAPISFTLEASGLAYITVQCSIYTSVGNAVGAVTVVVDAVDLFIMNIPSPLPQPASVSFPLNLVAGAHNLSIRLNTVGNANVTTFNANIALLVVGL